MHLKNLTLNRHMSIFFPISCPLSEAFLSNTNHSSFLNKRHTWIHYSITKPTFSICVCIHRPSVIFLKTCMCTWKIHRPIIKLALLLCFRHFPYMIQASVSNLTMKNFLNIRCTWRIQCSMTVIRQAFFHQFFCTESTNSAIFWNS